MKLNVINTKPTTNEFKLEYRNSHLFLILNKQKWLLDTGSPVSFSEEDGLILCGKGFKLKREAMGLRVKDLSKVVGTQVAGLLGTDVINHFDWLFDIPEQKVTISTGAISRNVFSSKAETISLNLLNGLPLLHSHVENRDIKAFLDTGAQFSYLEPSLLAHFPREKVAKDFHPFTGTFSTILHRVKVVFISAAEYLDCGRLPEKLAPLLTMTGAQGIIGNEILLHRLVLYSPSQKLLVLEVPDRDPNTNSGVEEEERKAA